MAGRIWRCAVVGASTLLGKELADELSGSVAASWDVTLLDGEDAGGLMTSAGEEAALIQTISAESFEGMDVVFFAGTPGLTRSHWKEAQAAGASVVDLTGALEREPGVLVRSPWTSGGVKADLATLALVPAHPAATMLAIAAERLRTAFGEVTLAATVMEPASQQDSAGVDELHAQTVGLLSFQAVPKDVYDAQVAFSLRSSLGGAAKLDLMAVEGTIRRHFALLAGVKGASLAVQVVQAPVFHGYMASVFVQALTASEDEVRKALHGGVVESAETDEPAASNDSVAGKGGLMVDVQAEPAGGFWLWLGADNLRFAARHAEACALELLAFRPVRRVQ